VPLAALVPLQPPLAVHEVALVELHVKVAAAPLSTTVVDTLSTAVGSDGTGVAGVDPEPPQAAKVNAAALVHAVIKNRIRPSLSSSIRYMQRLASAATCSASLSELPRRIARIANQSGIDP